MPVTNKGFLSNRKPDLSAKNQHTNYSRVSTQQDMLGSNSGSDREAQKEKI